MQQVQKQTEQKQDRAEVLTFLIYCWLFNFFLSFPQAGSGHSFGQMENWRSPNEPDNERRFFWLGTLFLKAISFAVKGERNSTAEEQTGDVEHREGFARSRGAVPVVYSGRRDASQTAQPMASTSGAVSVASVAATWDTRSLRESLMPGGSGAGWPRQLCF